MAEHRYVLVVNAGSSSLKLRVLRAEDTDTDRVVDRFDLDSWSGEGETERLERFVAGLGRVDAVGHRIVHGGTEFTEPVVIDSGVRDRIAALSELAPLHQPRGVAGIDALARVLPCCPSVACFDTAFHATLPEPAATYALPRDWNQRYRLRRYGFHGLSHTYVAGRSPSWWAARSASCARSAATWALGGRACRDRRRPFSGHHDGLHPAGRSGDGDPYRQRRPGVGALARATRRARPGPAL